jgi:hypothetical protein
MASKRQKRPAPVDPACAPRTGRKGPQWDIPEDTGEAEASPMARTGRPAKFSDELAEMILEKIAAGIPLAQIRRRHPECPSHETVRKWGLADPAFARRMERARGIGFEHFARRWKGWEDDTPENLAKWHALELFELSGRARWPLLSKWNPRLLARIRAATGPLPPLPLPAECREPGYPGLRASRKGLRKRAEAFLAARAGAAAVSGDTRGRAAGSST